MTKRKLREVDFDTSWEDAYETGKLELRDIFYLKQLAGIRLSLKEICEELKKR